MIWTEPWHESKNLWRGLKIYVAVKRLSILKDFKGMRKDKLSKYIKDMPISQTQLIAGLKISLYLNLLDSIVTPPKKFDFVFNEWLHRFWRKHFDFLK